MKIMRGAIYDLFEKYTKMYHAEKFNDLPILEVGRYVMKEIIAFSFTFEGEYSEVFHSALGNCNVGKKQIADEVNRRRRERSIIDGLPNIGEMTGEQVKDHLKYARKKISDHLEGLLVSAK